MIYAGIDYSLNCPCICVYDDSKGKFNHDTSDYFFQQKEVSGKENKRRMNLNIPNIHPSVQYTWKNNYYRFLCLADYFMSILIQHHVSIVAIEDYALGAMGRVFDIAECTSILKYMMLMTNISFYMFPPTYVKKVFSGTGNAQKGTMGIAYYKKYNVNMAELFGKESWDSPVSDMVDSHAMLYTYFHGENNDKYVVRE